jgi:hypothetical protein
VCEIVREVPCPDSCTGFRQEIASQLSLLCLFLLNPGWILQGLWEVCVIWSMGVRWEHPICIAKLDWISVIYLGKKRVLCHYLVEQPYLVFALKNDKNGYGRNFWKMFCQ